MKILSSKKAVWIIVGILIVAFLLWFFVIRKYQKRRKIADLALEEHSAWNFGSTKESSSAMRSSLSKYWNASGGPDYGAGAAWSAAFISWLFHETGAKDKFPYATSHSTYIRKAVENRKAGKKTGLIGYRPEEYSPKVGDLVCYPRQSGVTFDSTGAYMSHCDLVVDVDKRNNKITTIGGNVSDSVSKSIYDIDSKGRVITSKVHAVLRNKI